MSHTPNTKRNNTLRRPKTFALLVGLLVVGCIITVLVNKHSATNVVSQPVAPTGTVNYGPPSKVDTQIANQTKQQIIQNDSAASSESSISPSTGYTVTISRLSQTAAGQPVELRTIVTGTAIGSCNVAFSQNGTTFSETYQVGLEGTYYTCLNANIPITNFSSPGNWTATVNVSNLGLTSPSSEASLNVTD